MRKRSPVSKAFWISLAVIYAAALLLSHKSQTSRKAFPLIGDQPAGTMLLPARDADGTRIDSEQHRLFLRRFQPASPPADQTPVVMIHGSPGDGGAFNTLAQLIANTGRTVLVPDLPGYGRSEMGESLSYESQARVLYDLLDAHSIDRAHILGWSSGGGVAIQMGGQHPERVATVTLLAAIAAQETEGSGSYAFEHFKYAVGYIGLGYIPELIPHFGVLGDFDIRVGWLQAFWDSDQRKLDAIIENFTTPTLILHGRDDPLVASWAAERHHELMPETSRLIMLDASHFIPFMQPQLAAGYLEEFFARHDAPGVAPLTGYLNLKPVYNHQGFDRILHRFGDWIRALPWFVQIAMVIVLIRLFPYAGIIVPMIFVATMRLDLGVALAAMLLGRAWWLFRGADILDRPWTLLGWIRGIFYVLPAALLASVFAALADPHPSRFGLFGFVFAIVCGCLTLRLVRLACTWEGRRRILAGIGRIKNHEYWPSVIHYLPVLPLFMSLHPLKEMAKLTALNPGYAPDGGINEDSKSALNTRLPEDPALLDLVCVDAEPDIEQRFVTATDAIKANESLDGYPIIAKPDLGWRGVGVAKIEDQQQLRVYLLNHPEPIVLQRFHPGPCEFGVLWVRNPESIPAPIDDSAQGSIFAITVKHFPVLSGDGVRSIRRLILAHPRHRHQARVMIEFLKATQHRIPAQGETITLSIAGSHAQGAMFTDGQHLLTDTLEQRIDQIASGFCDDQANGFDIGRFDLRSESTQAFSRGEFGIVELNGLTSEPSNMYDPDRSPAWSRNILVGYWKRAKALADARIETNTGKPIPIRSLVGKVCGLMVRSVIARIV